MTNTTQFLYNNHGMAQSPLAYFAGNANMNGFNGNHINLQTWPWHGKNALPRLSLQLCHPVFAFVKLTTQAIRQPQNEREQKKDLQGSLQDMPKEKGHSF